jgi:hypothetical protein
VVAVLALMNASRSSLSTMTVHIPFWLIIVLVTLVLPYLFCRVGWRYTPKTGKPYQKTYRFLDLDGADRFILYLCCVLTWSGGLGFYFAPYLLIGVLPAVELSILRGWLASLSLVFAGVYIQRRFGGALVRREPPAEQIGREGG